jgi:DNA-binding CsgD family transcriptional regulator
MGVARSTVASQLHTIFQKTRTSRQSELVRLLHTLPQLDLGDMGGALLA